MELQQFQELYENLSSYEKEEFLDNNREQLLTDTKVNRPNLNEIEPEDIAEWLVEHYDMSTKEILDTFCDDLEELQDIVRDEVESEYYDEEDLY